MRVTNVEDNCCCENNLRKYWCDYSVRLGKQRWCVEEEDSSVNTGIAAEAATETAAATEAAATEVEESCQCCNDLQKFWCEEFLKLGHRRWCLERKDSAEETENSEEKTETLNHFKIVWEKDGSL